MLRIQQCGSAVSMDHKIHRWIHHCINLCQLDPFEGNCRILCTQLNTLNEYHPVFKHGNWKSPKPMGVSCWNTYVHILNQMGDFPASHLCKRRGLSAEHQNSQPRCQRPLGLPSTCPMLSLVPQVATLGGAGCLFQVRSSRKESERTVECGSTTQPGGRRAPSKAWN